MKKIFIIDGPSGCGKTTVALELEKLSNNIKYISSCTIRDKRPEEVEGREHFFLPKDVFEKKVKNGDLLGHYHMYLNQYGIDKEKILQAPQENILITYHSEEGTLKHDIEKLNIKYTRILILPDDANVLKSRIIKRNDKISDKEVEVRLTKYKEILSYKDKYDYVFINKEGFLQEVIRDIFSIIKNDK